VKSASLRLSGEATKPPTFTCEPVPNNTPLGFRTKTWPLALRLPRIELGSWPRTRLRAMDDALGWLKRTASLLPMLKLCQLMARFWVFWVMVVVAPAWAIVPAPVLVFPPVGSAWASGMSSAVAERINKAMAIKLRPNTDLLDPLTSSITTSPAKFFRAGDVVME